MSYAIFGFLFSAAFVLGYLLGAGRERNRQAAIRQRYTQQGTLIK